jgi:tetratricopeptide (TPR) repeat protein
MNAVHGFDRSWLEGKGIGEMQCHIRPGIFRWRRVKKVSQYRPFHPTNRLRVAAWLAILGVTSQLSFPLIGAAQTSPRAQTALSTSALLDKAKRLVQRGDPQGALSLLERADLHAAGASEIHALKGVCLALLAKPIESAEEFDQAIALRPNYAPTYLSSGLAFANFDNLDRASARLSTALRLDPHLPGARFNYALVLARAGKYSESEEQVDMAFADKHEKEPAIDLWRLKARDVYYQKKWQATINAYRKVLGFQPDWPEAHFAIGEAFYHLNLPQKSMPELEKAVALDQEKFTAHELLGKLYQNAGRQQEAIAQLEEAHRLQPNDRGAIYRLYRIYLHNGDTINSSRLQKELQNSIARDEAESDGEEKGAMLNNTGIELEKEGDFTGALDHYDQAAKIDVTNVVFQRNAALLLCKMGRPQEAIRRLRDILSLDSDDAETLQILAVANELAAGDLANKRTLPAAEASH